MEFEELRLLGKLTEAKDSKDSHIPKKLYRYRPITEWTLDNIHDLVGTITPLNG